MCRPDDVAPTPTTTPKSCCESIGDSIDESIYDKFQSLGLFVGRRPKLTIAFTMVLAIVFAGGMAMLTTENRPDELWVPQNTIAEAEETAYLEYFPRTSRFNTVLLSSDTTNILNKDILVQALEMHQEIERRTSMPTAEDMGDLTTDNDNMINATESSTFLDLCTKSGGSCASRFDDDGGSSSSICSCLVTSIFRQWNYDMETLQNDTDIIATINSYGSPDDLQAVLGDIKIANGMVVEARALSIGYFLQDRSIEQNGNIQDPINEAWEEQVFLKVVQEYDEKVAATGSENNNLELNYFATRSFGDEFGGAISGDLVFVQVSYLVVFIFLGATLGTAFKCGPGSRWTMSLAALVLVIFSTIAGFGLSSLFGLIYGPVHTLLPFVLLGIGVDDAYVIVNAFDRERKERIHNETEESLIQRSGRALGRAGASITVTSLTDLVAFAISASSALPALASFCAYAAIGIFFLWFFAATFFTACLVQDEKRQRDNRRDILCCLTRKSNVSEQQDQQDQQNDNDEGILSRYFRNYHAPAILSSTGKIVVLVLFSGLLGFGIFGAMNLTVEDSTRQFIPQDSYINAYVAANDEYFPSSTGLEFSIVFENGPDIYNARQELAILDQRLTGKTESPYFIAEPNSEDTYQNVMAGLSQYLTTQGSAAIGNVTLGPDNWPTTYEDFVTTLQAYASFSGPGSKYTQDVSYDETNPNMVAAYAVRLEYVKLTKERRGEVIDDADSQIKAMDSTRAMVASWEDLPPSFPYSTKYLEVEGFKIIKKELFQNVGLAIAAVAVIVLATVANFMTAFLITVCVACSIVEILGFMFAAGIVIDSVSVINIVLAVGLSVDYSAHVGHCFMVKGGTDKNARVTEALADIGSSVLSGATSTFLAVAILLGSSSYVFATLSIQFALTVVLGLSQGLILLPVLLAMFGPKAFSSAEVPGEDVTTSKRKEAEDEYEE